jgi:phytoene dehydrogenase-like protein
VQKFDVAVLGAGIAGLSVAALVSKAGKKVVLTDPGDRAGGCVAGVAQDGFRFTAGPNAVYGLEPGGILHALFASLDESSKEPIRAARYQVVLPDRRITITPGQQETLEELRREYPREIDRIAALYRDAGKLAQKTASSRISAYLNARRSAWKLLGRYRLSHELLTYLSVQSRYFFGQGLETLPLSSLVLLLSTAPAEFPAGYDHLAARIASRIDGQKGTILWNEPWPDLQSRGRRATGISTSQGTLEAKAVLINADGSGAEQVLFLGIREEVIPVSMEHTVLCLPDYQKPDDYFSLAVAPRGMNAPESMRALTVVFSVHSADFSTQDVLIERLLPVMPFLKDFVVTAAAQGVEARRYPMPDPIAPQMYSSDAAHLQPRRKTFKNVLMVPDASRFLFASARNAHLVASRLI